MSASQVLRGEIYYADLDPTVGSEMQKIRPAVVVSNDVINENSSVVVVCPITDATGKGGRYHIYLPKGEGGLTKDSIAHCGQVRAIDKIRLKNKLGTLRKDSLDEVNKGLRIVLSV